MLELRTSCLLVVIVFKCNVECVGLRGSAWWCVSVRLDVLSGARTVLRRSGMCLLSSSSVYAGLTHTHNNEQQREGNFKRRLIFYHVVGWGGSLADTITVAFTSGYGRGPVGLPVT